MVLVYHRELHMLGSRHNRAESKSDRAVSFNMILDGVTACKFHLRLEIPLSVRNRIHFGMGAVFPNV